MKAYAIRTHKAARVAAIVLLKREYGLVNINALSELMGVHIRTIQRDMHAARDVECLLNDYDLTRADGLLR